MEVKVIVCCQTQLCAEGVWCLLEQDDDIQVLGTANTEEKISSLMKYDPDVIVTDFACCNVILKKLSPRNDKKVLLINDGSDYNNENIKVMISDGLGGILPIEAGAKLLQKAIKKLNEGELWIDRHTIREVLSRRETRQSQINLTKKEKEILNYVCIGLSNKEIAEKLFISEQTVKSHCNHLFKKFGVSSRLKLALQAMPKYFSENLNRLQ